MLHDTGNTRQHPGPRGQIPPNRSENKPVRGANGEQPKRQHAQMGPGLSLRSAQGRHRAVYHCAPPKRIAMTMTVIVITQPVSRHGGNPIY